MTRKICFLWLFFLSSFILGMSIYDLKVWPYGAFVEVKQFVIGGKAEDLSLIEKISNDFNFKPNRHIKTYSSGIIPASASYIEIEDLPLNPRRESPKLLLSADAPQGYRILFGSFDFKETLHGVIMLDPEGRIAHIWYISEDDLKWEHTSDTNIFPHGFEIAPDGSIIVTYDGGHSITRYDFDSNIVWRKNGGFDHSIHFEETDAVWCWENIGTSSTSLSRMVKIDYNTGESQKIIPMQDIIEANPDIDIFSIQQTDGEDVSIWHDDPWHPNDVEPLPVEYEKYFPGFTAGDLLVSLRSIDLVFVLDQNTLKVKWWRQGLVRRQHDPDWNKRGTITIFNNNMHRGYSNIIELDPITYDSRILLNGDRHNFYTYWRGKHDILDNGGILVTSPDQGRVFEVDKEGNIVFEFINTYGENGETLAVSEARFLQVNYFVEGLL